MSRGALAMMQEVESSRSSARRASSVRVSQPGDAHEVEADRVADTVSRGGRVAGWSLSPSKADVVQRQPVPGPAASSSFSDVAAGVAPAVLATPTGKKVLDASTSLITTPVGGSITGAAAVGIISGLAKAKTPLPAQLPEIPLTFVKKGLSVKLTWNGPVNSPTDGSIVLKYEPRNDDKKPQAQGEKIAAETKALVAQGEQFKPTVHAVGPLAGPAQPQSAEDAMFARYSQQKLAEIGSFARPLPGVPAPKAPAAAETKPEAKAAPIPAPTPAPISVPEAKKEDLPVQRKAVAAAPIATGSADVDAVMRSSGSPLEPGVRRDMESRIGYDFSHVRVHTDESASSSARNLSARAYTVGGHVAFAGGQYAPQSGEGRKLIAHELTHVVQQTSSPDRAHPVVRPAVQHVQRSWWDDLKGLAAEKVQQAKNWLLQKLRGVPGYKLFSVLIERDLLSGEHVDRTPEALLGGVLDLVEGGKTIYEKLKGAYDALKKGYDWLMGRVKEHHLTLQDFDDLLHNALDSVELSDPEGSWNRIKKMFADKLDDIIALGKEVASQVMELILEGVLTVFPAGKKIWPILQKAGSALGKIAANPKQFALTLLDGMKKGFQRFYDKIGTNLLNGLQQFVFEEVGLPDLQPPKGYDPASLFSFALEILGLTYRQRRAQLVEKLQPLGGEVVVAYAEKAVEMVQQVRAGGFGVLWQMIKDKLSDIATTIFGAIKGWAIKAIVKAGMEKVLALSNPAGEIVEVIKDIVEMVKFFIDKATQMIDMFESMVNSFSDMAEGNSEGAAVAVESTIKRSIPLILRFLAGIFGLSGFGEDIRKVIHSIRQPIDDAIGKVLDFVVAKITPIWNRVKDSVLARIESVKEWWTKPKKFNYGEVEHEITLEGEGSHPEVYINSKKTALEHFLNDVKATKQEKDAILKAAAKLNWRQGPMEKQKPADDEPGAAAYERLRVLMGKLKARKAPPLKILPPGPLDAAGGGTKAEAFLSTSRDLGSEPGGKDPAAWEDLGARLRDEKSYVRGHLLSMRLGGQGTWENMMPITNKVNQRMNAQVEAPLKKATANTSRYYHYKVVAEYDPVTLPELSEKPTKAELYQRGKLAEKRLKSLSWTTEPAEYDESAGWKAVPGPLVDADGAAMKESVAAGEFTPPTLK